MTGVTAAFCGFAPTGGVNAAFSAFLSNVSVSPGSRSASVTFYPDGSSSSSPSGAPTNWFFPTTVGAGSAWSVRVTGGSTGTTVGGMTSGVWYPLTSPRTVSFSNTNPSTEAIGSAGVAFSHDGGATIVNAGSIVWDVGYLA